MIISIYILILAISGLSKAVQDVSASNYANSKLKSLNASFWCKSEGWKSKWKNGNPAEGEKFFGSSTFLVFLTDAWHLFDVIRDITLIVSLSISVLFFTPMYIFIAIAYPIRQVFFELFYRWINK